MDNDKQKPATRCVHAGTYHDPRTRGVTSPVFTATSYGFPNPDNASLYPRYFNIPNHRVVAEKISALEEGEDALVLGSGMAAVSTTLMALLRPGDHALFQSDIYGGTHHFVVDELPRYGIEVTLVDQPTADGFARHLRPTTRLVYFESPSNPLLRLVDIAAVAAWARQQGLISVIDNTFATPINQRPLALGADVVLHSGTKYLNGHSDVNCGAVVAGRAWIDRITELAINHGATLDVRACYLLERGLRTLALRVRQQNENALRLARFLQQHPRVARVNYPGLPEHPDHAVAARQMDGFGGMLSFELGDGLEVDTLLGRFSLVTPALSLGGVETLICVPCQTSHSKMSAEDRRRAGISDRLLRLSAGIEDAADLLDDFARALA
jgi:cystathionine beta-lyase